MAYQQKEGQGSLFKNEKQNDRQPDFKGTIMIKGVLYDIAGWNRTSQNGREYLSLQASEKSGDAPQPQQYQNFAAQQQQWQPRPAAAPQPSFQAPAPSIDDLPAGEPEEDLPF